MSELMITDGEMRTYANKCKYMVIFPDKSVLMYGNLREIAQEIYVPHCTISKNLREHISSESKELGCICESHTTGHIYYVAKLQ